MGELKKKAAVQETVVSTKRVGGYSRVSTEEQIKGYSLETQKVEIEKFCIDKGWQVVQWFEDAGFSGAEDWNGRQGLRGLLLAVKKKTIDVVVAVNTDRISRDEYITAVIKHHCKKHGADMIYTRFPTVHGAHGDFAQSIKEDFDVLERKQISERTSKTMATAKAQGKWLARIPWGHRLHRCQILGHTKCGLDGCLEAVDPLVSQITKMSEDKMTITEIARTLELDYFIVRRLVKRLKAHEMMIQVKSI